jgi:hypothetical protein
MIEWFGKKKKMRELIGHEAMNGFNYYQEVGICGFYD